MTQMSVTIFLAYVQYYMYDFFLLNDSHWQISDSGSSLVLLPYKNN
jgi:hypothetical protein